MGRMSVATAGKKAPWSLPFKRCIAHLTHTDRWTCLLFKVKTKFCQMSISGGLPGATCERRAGAPRRLFENQQDSFRMAGALVAHDRRSKERETSSRVFALSR